MSTNQQDKKPFNLITQLVKSQIYVEKLLKKHTISEVQPNLEEIMQKYDWIREEPKMQQQAPGQIRPVKPRKFNYRIVFEDELPQEGVAQSQGQEVSEKILAKEQPRARPAPVAKQQPQPKNEEPSSSQQLSQSKFDPFAQSAAPDDQRVQCQYCGRKFDPDRIEKHQGNCDKNPVKIAIAEQRKKELAKKVAGRQYQ